MQSILYSFSILFAVVQWVRGVFEIFHQAQDNEIFLLMLKICIINAQNPASTQLTDAEMAVARKSAFDAHNAYRRLHNVTEFVWNDNITEFSQNWSEYLAKINALVHSNSRLYGENIFYLCSFPDVRNRTGNLNV
jgi:uncharacterized protein YkwD